MNDGSSQILESWQANAAHWVAALENEELQSRKLVTNQAIIDAVVRLTPKTIIDIGCGEGWLCRALSSLDIITTGLDGTSALIDNALKKSNQNFCVASFEDIILKTWKPSTIYDVAVINFALYEHEQTERLLHTIRNFSKQLVIQTLHPFAGINTNDNYVDGWRNESWAGLQRPFTHPYAWYYRTMGSWINLLVNTGWTINSMQEPVHPVSGFPLSLILVASV